MSISKITNTGRVSTKDLHDIYDGRIEKNSTLVTDKMNSYVRFTNANGIELVQLKTGKAKKGIYNIQHINGYHSQLKRFIKQTSNSTGRIKFLVGGDKHEIIFRKSQSVRQKCSTLDTSIYNHRNYNKWICTWYIAKVD